MQNHYTIRQIQDSDVAGVLDIYKYYVENTSISFEYEVPSLAEYLSRIRINTEKYPWLVCLNGDEIIGFAYGSTHRYRTAYQWSPETTVYLSAAHQSRGVGKVLYKTLLDLLRYQGYINVFAGVALPNEKSLKLHHAMGFQEIGIFKAVGFKFGMWHSTQWLQFNLSPSSPSPAMPKLLNEVKASSDFLEIIDTSNSKLNAMFHK